jgi:hypothetical protein
VGVLVESTTRGNLEEIEHEEGIEVLEGRGANGPLDSDSNTFLLKAGSNTKAYFTRYVRHSAGCKR